MTDQAVHFFVSLLALDKMASFTLMMIAASIIYLIVWRIPPMIEKFLTSLSSSMEKLATSVAELARNTTEICTSTAGNTTAFAKHHENAVEVKEAVEVLGKKIGDDSLVLHDIRTILQNRPCIIK